MVDLLQTAIRHLAAVLQDNSLSARDTTSYVTMARDNLLTLMARESDEALIARLTRGELQALRAMLIDPDHCEKLQYSYGQGASEQFFALANEEERCGLRNLFTAMLSGAAFRYRHWQRALTQIELHLEVDNYLFASPKVLFAAQERAQFVDYTTRLCEVLAEALERDATALSLPRVAKFLSRMRNEVVYSCEGSTIDLARAKGALITRYADRLTPSAKRDWQPALNADGPIRVGLLWSDMVRRTENIAGVASGSTLRSAGFHVTSFIFTNRAAAGFSRSLAAEIGAISDALIPLNEDVERGIDVIRDASLDVLIIQNNVTWGFSPFIGLCSRRLAPIQAVTFCSVLTTGMPSITTYISGAMSERSADPQAMYTENLALLPGSCLICDDIDYRAAIAAGGRFARIGLAAAGTVFASGANFHTLHPQLTATWIEILARVPDSVLVLYPFDQSSDRHYPWSIMESRLEAQCRERGVDPGRIIVSGAWNDREPLRELLSQADVYLDSFPNSGGLSCLDAVAQGVPIVTRAGQTRRENQTADLLDMLDLGDLIARDRAGYVEQAVRLALDAERWASTRRQLLDRWEGGEYFDAGRYADALAAVIRAQVPDRPGIAESTR